MTVKRVFTNQNLTGFWRAMKTTENLPSGPLSQGNRRRDCGPEGACRNDRSPGRNRKSWQACCDRPPEPAIGGNVLGWYGTYF